MSAEGKKKRGISGVAKARSEPFRLNGWRADWQAHAQGCYNGPGSPSSGSVTMRGIIGGILAERMGFPMPDLPLLETKYAHAQSRVTHPLLVEAGPVPVRKARAA